ncbi:MAG: LysR family transcriptional regulator [Fusicatenibacter sp.]|nr:LysR family transcriptional regulator [Lachnospiraceae bacterium]MDY2937751.1 LysR family transcriptional regulator [Fusicatenibacter sp.]
MTLESYRNFVAIVECGSILAASKKLLIAQPSLSNQLKNMEQTYGARLINRGSRSIELTEAGRIFYNKAREICRIEDSIRMSISCQQAGYREQLKISIPAGNSIHYIHRLFEKFVKKHPDINYDVYEIASDFVVPNVLNGITEIGLIRASIPQYGSLASYPYEKDDIVAVIPKQHPLAQSKEPLEITDFTGYSLAIPFDILNIIYTVFGQNAVSPNVSIITSINETAIEWARSFQTVALIPYSEADEKKTEDMILRPIANDGMFVMSVFLLRKDRELSNAGKMFLQENGIDFDKLEC